MRIVSTTSLLLATALSPWLVTAAIAETAAGAATAVADAEANRLTGSAIIVTATKVNAATPITSSLKTTEPQSIVNRSVIQNVVPATSDFNDVILLTPSASGTTNGNGPGLSETKLILRGFKDGQYNVTFDGVPFGDSNDPTHHSTSYFPNGTYEQIIIDRGPGNASQLGQANYGGNVNIVSRALTQDFHAQFEGTYGSYNTQLYRGTLETGAIPALGGASAVFVAEYKKSNGALSYSPIRAENIFGKIAIPIGDKAVLTVEGSYNDNFYNQSDNNGATIDEVNRYGKGFALTSQFNPSADGNPYFQTRYDWNWTHKQTDFEIVRLQVDLTPHLHFDSKLYTYYYNNFTFSTADDTTPGATQSTQLTTVPGTGTSKGTLVGGPKTVGDIPGYTKLNQYRQWGNITQLDYDFDFGSISGILKGGIWYESSTSHRLRYDYDLTLSTIRDGELISGVANNREKSVGQTGVDANGNAITGPLLQLNGQPVPLNISYDENSSWQQYQPFAQLEVHPFPGLTISPGVKYVHFTRTIFARIASQSARIGIDADTTYKKTLPFTTVNYLIKPNLSVYAQYAKGFLIPPLATLEVGTQNPSSPAPASTTNYQAGTVYAGEHLNVDFDGYYIKLSNTLANIGPAGAIITNTGHPSTYKGLEAQVSYSFNFGLTVLANGSLNSAKDDVTHNWINLAPDYTATAGAVYNLSGLKFSYVQKFVGRQYADINQAVPLKAYSIGTASVGYQWKFITARVAVYNVLDTRPVTSISGSGVIAAGATNSLGFNNLGPGAQYFFTPGRSYQATLGVSF